jgi:hypothetical protein
MPLDLNNIINIINNKLYKSKYITAAFFLVFFYTYYILFIYLQEQNYILLLLYFSLLLLLYNKFDKFSYFICFIALILIKIFNIDYQNKIIENVENAENVEVDTTADTIRERSEAKGDRLKADANNSKTSKTKNNPCETYITNRLIESGIKISTNSYNMDNKKDESSQQISNIMPQEPINTPEQVTFQ